MGAGSFAGPSTPNQGLISKPRTPDSASVGVFGWSAERFAPVIASARTRPLCTCGIAAGLLTIMNCASPLMSAVKPGPVPLYGMCEALMPAFSSNSSVARCVCEPTPPVA